MVKNFVLKYDRRANKSRVVMHLHYTAEMCLLLYVTVNRKESFCVIAGTLAAVGPLTQVS